MSPITKNAFRCKLLWGAIRTILLIGPIVGAFIYALASGQVHESRKTALGVVFAFTLIICLVNLCCSFHLRTPGWLFIFFCLWLVDNVAVIIIIVGCCTIADELIAAPIYKHYREAYKFNKQYDKRQELDKRYRFKEEHQEE